MKSRPISDRPRRRERRRPPAQSSAPWYTVVLVMLIFVVVWFTFGVLLGIGARGRLNEAHLAAIHSTQTLAALTANVESTQTIAAYLGLDVTATQQAIAQVAAATAAAPTATPTATLTPTAVPTGTPTPMAGGTGLIAYVSDQDGNPEIYVRDPATGVVSRITRDSGADDNPTWSADGQWLAFQSDMPAPGRHIFVVNVADCLKESNGCPLVIRQVTAGTALNSYPLWSADGQQIVYSSHDGPRFWIRTTTLDGRMRDVTQLPSDSRLYDWSPVDLSLTFFGARPGFAGVFEMLRLPFGGTSSDRSLVTDSAGAVEFLNYSQDRQHVVYEELVGSRRMLFLADGTCARIDDCVLQQLTNDQFDYLTPRFSPDGTLIVTASNRSGHLDLYAMDLQGNIVQRLTSDPWSETNGTWQP